MEMPPGSEPPPAELLGARYVYDGNGRGFCTPEPRSGERGTLVKSTVNGVVTYYPSNSYQEEGNTITKYYSLGGQRVAMRTDGVLSWLILDHLGSTNVTANEDGTLQSEIRYTPFGETRHANGITPSDYRYTGQLSQAELGLYYYVARWYDPQLGRFVQADTVVPGAGNPGAYDRYAYVLNNPINLNDPSGHDVCDEEGICYTRNGWYRAPNTTQLNVIYTWEMIIRNQYGITLVDSDRSWSLENVRTAHVSLEMVDNKLNGGLKSLVGGTTFVMASQAQCTGESGSFDCYHGITSSTGITFYASSQWLKIPITNFLHEIGHLIDFVPATNNAFSGSLPQNPIWVRNGYVNSNLLLGKLISPIQAKPMNEPYDPHEYWADAFANYVADNIDLEQSAGMAMAIDIANALNPYTVTLKNAR